MSEPAVFEATRVLAPGDRYQGYQIVDLLVKGGRSYVYRALKESSDEAVTLKIGASRLSEEEAMRLRREFATTPFVDHPNLERTIAAGVDDERRAWCVTELLHGQSLEVLLATGGPLASERAAAIGAQVARGLEALHSRQLLYRNLKLSNVLVLDPGDSIRVLDALPSTTARGDRPFSTPETMSPEEFSGADLDVRADVYSLGALLFHLVTGRPPFDGTHDEIREGHLHRAAPRLRAVRASAQSLEAIINQALEKRPARRFGSIAAMADALEGAADHAKVAPRDETPAKVRQVRPWLWALLAAGLIGVLALAAWIVRRGGP